MKHPSVLFVFGTRPEAIKLAPVIREMRSRSNMHARVCVTGQHREILRDALELFEIQVDCDMDIMEQNQSLNHISSAVLSGFPEVLDKEQPDWVLVQGDTTSSMAAALAAFHNRVRVGHVEAGLRTGNRFHPFPEEVNRRIADAVADAHFAPTHDARKNLLQEGISPDSIFVTGNTGIDALLWMANRPVTQSIASLLNSISDRRILFVTAHRRESFGEPLQNICAALKELARRFSDTVTILYPVHPNPNVQKAVQVLMDVPGIELLPPVDYQTAVQIMKHSFLVLTDSGGIQEEAPALGKPVIVLRDHTERTEGIEAGSALLAGTSTGSIVTTAVRLLEDASEYRRMSVVRFPYGDGHASERIVDAILQLS